MNLSFKIVGVGQRPVLTIGVEVVQSQVLRQTGGKDNVKLAAALEEMSPVAKPEAASGDPTKLALGKARDVV